MARLVFSARQVGALREDAETSHIFSTNAISFGSGSGKIDYSILCYEPYSSSYNMSRAPD